MPDCRVRAIFSPPLSPSRLFGPLPRILARSRGPTRRDGEPAAGPQGRRGGAAASRGFESGPARPVLSRAPGTAAPRGRTRGPPSPARAGGRERRAPGGATGAGARDKPPSVGLQPRRGGAARGRAPASVARRVGSARSAPAGGGTAGGAARRTPRARALGAWVEASWPPARAIQGGPSRAPAGRRSPKPAPPSRRGGRASTQGAAQAAGARGPPPRRRLESSGPPGPPAEACGRDPCTRAVPHRPPVAAQASGRGLSGVPRQRPSLKGAGPLSPSLPPSTHRPARPERTGGRHGPGAARRGEPRPAKAEGAGGDEARGAGTQTERQRGKGGE